MREERLVDIKVIPFYNFKEKIALTQKYKKCKCEVIDNKFIYIARYRHE